MPCQIKESDWKTLKPLHRLALERFCKQILDELAELSADSAKSHHQRYLEVYQTVRSEDREIVRLFDDLRRSTALEKLAAIYAKGLLEPGEFARFSEETQRTIRRWVGSDDA